jgi:hypothetical protein
MESLKERIDFEIKSKARTNELQSSILIETHAA